MGSITAIVANIDQVFDSGDASMISKMKAVFGLETLSDGDFAQAIAWPSMLQNAVVPTNANREHSRRTIHLP